VSMHAPTLPSMPSWETPITASREIVEAIAGAADSAVDAATSAVKSARRRRRGTPKVVWLALGAAVLTALAVVRSRRGSTSNSHKAADHLVANDESVVSAADRSNGTAPDGEPVAAGAEKAG
jgi:hypothetical protein